mmetsp:Transcript_4553/g.10615  ORF Transcript_4553/g.10615 Transcript_4553/m.10615 type:complete len:306 (-) Transcript_4553:824-1741(-)
MLGHSGERLSPDELPGCPLALYGEGQLAHRRLRLRVTDNRERLPGTMVEKLGLLGERHSLHQGRILVQHFRKVEDVLLCENEKARGPYNHVRRGLHVGTGRHCEAVRVRQKPRLPGSHVGGKWKLNHGILCAQRQVAPLARHREAVVQEVIRIRANTVTGGHGSLRPQCLPSTEDNGCKIRVIRNVGVGALLLVLVQVIVCEERPLRHGEVMVHKVDEGHDRELGHRARLVLPIRQLHGFAPRHHNHGPFLEVNDGDAALNRGDQVRELVILRLNGRVHVKHVHVEQIRPVQPMQIVIVPENRDV